jgi:hypothetical protein
MTEQKKETSASSYRIGRGLTAIDAAIMGRIGRTSDDWSLTAADERDARLMALFGKAREMGWRSKQRPCHVERAFVGTESSSDGSAKR